MPRGQHPNSRKNLIKSAELTPKERSARASHAGSAPRPACTIKHFAKLLNDAPANESLKDAMHGLNMPTEGATNAAGIALAVYQAALNGNMPAVEKWEKYVGQDGGTADDTYTATVSGSAAEGFVVTNTHVSDTTRVQATKVWSDNSNIDGLRPASVTLQLYKTVDGVTLPVPGKTVTLANDIALAEDGLYTANAEVTYGSPSWPMKTTQYVINEEAPIWTPIWANTRSNTGSTWVTSRTTTASITTSKTTGTVTALLISERSRFCRS